MRMIDAQAVVLGERLVGAGEHEVARGTSVLRRIEDGIAPRLPLGVRATRRSAHEVAAKKRAGVTPRIAIGVADLEIAVEEQVRGPLAHADMLVVNEELTERVAIDRACMTGEERRPQCTVAVEP
jgi:hypothetical protein